MIWDQNKNRQSTQRATLDDTEAKTTNKGAVALVCIPISTLSFPVFTKPK